LRLRLGPLKHLDHAVGAVDADEVAVVHGGGGCPGAHHCRDSVLSGSDSSMGQHAAAVGDDGPDLGEEGSPRGRRERADEDVADLDFCEPVWLEDHAGATFHQSRCSGEALEGQLLGSLLARQLSPGLLEEDLSEPEDLDTDGVQVGIRNRAQKGRALSAMSGRRRWLYM
jgi:hypothetical protein